MAKNRLLSMEDQIILKHNFFFPSFPFFSLLLPSLCFQTPRRWFPASVCVLGPAYPVTPNAYYLLGLCHIVALPSEIVAVQSLSHVRLFVTPWTAICQASLSFTISRSLLIFMSSRSMTPSSHLILCCPLVLLPSVIPSIRVFSSESALHIRWPKYWSFNFSISPSSSGLIAFRIDWFDLLAVQGTLKSHLQHHNLKASVLRCSAFFMVQLSHLYMTTGKTIASTVWTFVV